MTGREYILLRAALELFYSFARQYISWYEREIKNVVK